MLNLCLDTSGSFLNIAVCREDKVLAGLSREVGAGHSEILAEELTALFKENDIGWSDIGLLSAVTGPGSFTGLRVGIAFLKGLAAGLGLPVLSLNTLDAMACSQGSNGVHLSPLIDAKKKEVYAALYKMEDGRPIRISDYQASSPQAWLEAIPQDALLFGSGEVSYREMLQTRHKGLRYDGDFLRSGKILSGLAKLSNRLYQEGQTIEPARLDAFYVRQADAILKKMNTGQDRDQRSIS